MPRNPGWALCAPTIHDVLLLTGTKLEAQRLAQGIASRARGGEREIVVHEQAEPRTPASPPA